MNEQNTLQTPWSEEILPAEPSAPVPAPYGGFWRRAIAFLIDSFLSSLPPTLLCFPLMFWVTARSFAAQQTEQNVAIYTLLMMGIYLLWNLLGALSFWLYFSLLESGKHQATWGKRLLKIKVVSKTGQRLTFLHATGRTFAKVFSYFVFYLGFLMVPFSNRKRALHDCIAETYVVKASFQPADPLPNTQSRWGLFIAFVAAVVLIGGAISLHIVKQSANPTLLKAQIAAVVLPLLAEEGEIPQPITQNDIVYSQEDMGYRAVFQDETGQEYGLFLPEGASEVCCDVFPGQDCQSIAIPVCQ